jgi:hypothetical protein
MSDQKNFFTRWSRRKLETAGVKAQPARPAAEPTGKQAAPGEEPAQAVVARAPEANAPPAPEFDLTKLPSLESIGANSDISAFLQASVPSALRHAALRRAWAADPAIRDFKGLAENAWDFTDPEAMPGFGALDPQVDIKQLVAEIFRDVEPEAKSPAASNITVPAPGQPAPLPKKSNTTADIPAASEPESEPQQAAPKSDPLLQRNVIVATQRDETPDQSAALKARRHGSAMPQ